jgi:DNA repair protein RadC
MFAIGEVYLGYNRRVKVADAMLVTTSESAAEVLRSVWDTDTLNLRESFKVLLLTRGNRAINVYHHSEGGVSGTISDIRLIMQSALLANASGIILAHNHPSGNRYPSEADRSVTAKLKDAANLFDITVLDHVIITEDSYLSLADEGLL